MSDGHHHAQNGPKGQHQAKQIDLDDVLRLIKESENVQSGLPMTEAFTMLNGYLTNLGPEGTNRLSETDRSRVIITLLKAMKSRNHDAALQGQAVSAASKLCLKAETCDFFSRKGGIEAVLSVMNTNKDFPIVQNLCCFMLVQLDPGIKPLRQEMKQEIASAVLSALEKFTQDSDLSMCGIRVFFTVRKAVAVEGNVQKIIRVIVKAMRTHPHEKRIQATGCTVLTAFVDAHERYIKHMLAEGVMSALLAGMKVCLEGGEQIQDLCLVLSSSPTSNEKVVEIFCNAIGVMYKTEEHRQVEPGLKVLTRAIVMHMQSPVAIKDACWAMALAMRATQENQGILGRQAVRAILLAMTTHKDNLDMQRSIFACLAELVSGVEEHCNCLLEKDTLPMLLRQTDMYMSDHGVRISASMLFRHMVHHGRTRALDAIIEAGVITRITKIMHIFMDSAGSPGTKFSNFGLLTCCSTLGQIMLLRVEQYGTESSSTQTESSLFYKRMAQDGVADAIIAALPMLDDPDTVQLIEAQTSGLEALSCLCRCNDNTAALGFRALRPALHVMSSFCARGDLKHLHTKLEAVMFLCSGIFLLGKIMTYEPPNNQRKAWQEEFAKCGGFKVVGACLHMFEQYCGTELLHTAAYHYQTSEDAVLISAVVVLCFVIADHRENQKQLAQQVGLIDAILRIMDKNPHYEVFCSQSCAILGLIIESQKHIVSDMIHNQQAPEIILKCCKVLVPKGIMTIEAMQILVKNFTLASSNQGQAAAAAAAAAAATASTTQRCGSASGALSSCLVHGDNTVCDAIQKQLTLGADSMGTDNSQAQRRAAEKCVACGKTAADVGATKLMKCSGCTIAPKYCSPECQQTCWREHKAECKANRKIKK
jgi:hypothetical protein